METDDLVSYPYRLVQVVEFDEVGRVVRHHVTRQKTTELYDQEAE